MAQIDMVPLDDTTPIFFSQLDMVWEGADVVYARRALMTVALVSRGHWRPRLSQRSVYANITKVGQHVVFSKEQVPTLTVAGLELLCSTPTLDVDSLMRQHIHVLLGNWRKCHKGRGSYRHQPLWEDDSWARLVTTDAAFAEIRAAQGSKFAA